MKKLSLLLLAAVFSLSIYSCRETTETETNVDDLETEVERTGEEVEGEVESTGEEIEAEVERTDDV